MLRKDQKCRKIGVQGSCGERVRCNLVFGLQQMNSLGSSSQKVGMGIQLNSSVASDQKPRQLEKRKMSRLETYMSSIVLIS